MLDPSDSPAGPDDSDETPDELDVHGTADATLSGYFREHDRPPAFGASDGYPYTVSMEVEKVADLQAPYVGYLVFPRWAETGLGVVGHVESPVLVEGRTKDDVLARLGDLSLHRVKTLLEEAIQRSGEEGSAP